MIEPYPWIAPVLSWLIVLVLLVLVLLAAFTRKTVTHADYMATLIASLMLALAGMTTAMLSVLPRGTIPLDIVGLELATLRGVASALYLGVLLHILEVGPHWVRRFDARLNRLLRPLERGQRETHRHVRH